MGRDAVADDGRLAGVEGRVDSAGQISRIGDGAVIVVVRRLIVADADFVIPEAGDSDVQSAVEEVAPEGAVGIVFGTEAFIELATLCSSPTGDTHNPLTSSISATICTAIEFYRISPWPSRTAASIPKSPHINDHHPSNTVPAHQRFDTLGRDSE